MAKDKKIIYVDENPNIHYPEQGTSYSFLDDGTMRYTMYLPNVSYLLPQEALKSVDGFMNNLGHICRAGAEILNKPKHCEKPTQPPSDFSDTLFFKHYSTGLRALNSPRDFEQYPLLSYSMDIDFDSKFNLKKMLSPLTLEEISKPEKIFFNFDEVNQMSKPSKLKKLGDNITHLATMVAFEFSCNQNPLMQRAYDGFKRHKNNSNQSMAERLVFYQGFLLRKKLPYFSLENDLPLLVSTQWPKQRNEPKQFNIVQDVSEESALIYSTASITKPFSCPYALANGALLAINEKSRQSSLGHNDLELDQKTFSPSAMRDLNNRISNFIVNYNKPHKPAISRAPEKFSYSS